MKSETDLGSIHWTKVILTVTIVCGLFLRFFELDLKIYMDEVFSSFWICGYSPQEVVRGISSNQLFSPEDLLRYQQIKPGTSIANTVQLLAQYDTQHPPLYYVLLRIWAVLVGDSIGSLRLISALLSLIALPMAYWLAMELFGSQLIGWMLVALISVSPLHLLYAQENRQYGLWIGLILFADISFLRAVHKPSPARWGWYTLSLILGLYTHLLTAAVMIAHGIYLAILREFKFSQLHRNYAIASSISCLCFIPWIIALFNSSEPIAAAGWQSARISSLILFPKIWITNTSRLFFDINLDIPFLIVLIGIVFLLGYALRSIREAPSSVWLFILITAGVPALTLILPDLLLGGIRSIVSRYLFPTWISIQLLVAYYFGSVIEARNSLHTLFQKGLVISMLLAGLLSCAVASQEASWWIKFPHEHQPKTAQFINQTERPLLLSATATLPEAVQIISLSYRLDPEVRILSIAQFDATQIDWDRVSENFSDVFVFNLTEDDLQQIFAESIVTWDPIFSSGNLWKLSL